MKTYLLPTILAVFVLLPSLSGAAAPQSFDEKLSYSMGYEVGAYFKDTNAGITEEFLLKGISDAFKGTAPVLTEEEMLAIKRKFAEDMQARQLAEMEEMKAANLAAGQAYLEENKKKEGVVVTDSGLQYEVLVEGSGDKATAEDKVKVEYVGTLIDGTEFDSTAKHGQPAEFMVNQVIPGWSEALQLMSPGSKLRLVIPAELAYGEQGAAPTIQPNSVLVFEVEMLDIIK